MTQVYDIDVFNQSTVVSDAEIATTLAAIQTGITRDFAPFWGVDARLHLVSTTVPAVSTHWRHIIFDNSDQAGDLGYHVDDNGIPEMKSFAAETLRDGGMLSVTMDHEFKEALADPTASLTFQIGDITYIQEVCDAVEDDADGYDEAGVRLSNFVLPSYYGKPNPVVGWTGGQFDFCGKLTAGVPTLSRGGYVMFKQNNLWQSTMARHLNGSLGSRAMRNLGRSRYRAAHV